MNQLFKKAVVFTDIHFGKKNNSIEHNMNNEQFILWMIEQGKIHNAETAIFMGDWHDSRRSINVSTLNMSLNCMELINNSFEKFYFIVGNHDLFYKEKRDLNSIEFARNLKNVVIVNEPIFEKNVGLIPWVLESERETIAKTKCKYMFGHFEISSFMMNSNSFMPESGIHPDLFKGQEYIFSGHFHKRQIKKNKNNVNIIYIGNCFPHDYNDVLDNDRGIMILEWGKEPEFFNWPNQPEYKYLSLSEILNDINLINDKTFTQVTNDLDITYEESQFIREVLMANYKPKELIILPNFNNDDEYQFDSENKIQTVDEIVIEGISNITNTNIDASKLIDLYNSLDIE